MTGSMDAGSMVSCPFVDNLQTANTQTVSCGFHVAGEAVFFAGAARVDARVVPRGPNVPESKASPASRQFVQRFEPTFLRKH